MSRASKRIKNPNRLFLIVIFVFTGISLSGAQQAVTDTSLVNTLIIRANKCANDKPDSSVIYYQKAIDLSQKGIQNKNLKNIFIRKIIVAKIGLGLHFYQNVDYETAIQHFESAYELAKELNEPYYIGECLFNFAEVYLEQSKYSLAMTRYFEALQQYQKSGSDDGAYWSYLGMGIIQKQCGNFPDAVTCYEKARTIAEKAGKKLEAAYCFNNEGNVYRKQGDLPKAMGTYQKALSCFIEMDDELSASDCLNNIGNLYLEKGDPFRALDYYNRAIHSEKVKADNYRMISRYKNLADAYSTLKDYPNASLYLEKAIYLAEKSDDKMQLASCYTQVGNLHLSNGSNEIGISYLKKSVDLFHEVGAKAEEAECLIELSKAELKYGKTNDAFRHAELGEQMASDAGAVQTIYAASNALASVWEKKGDPEKSLSYLKKAMLLKDSIYSVVKNRTIEEIEAGFTRTRLENENQILAQQGKLQQQSLRIRNIAVFSLLLSLVLSIVIIWLVYKRHKILKAFSQHEISLNKKEISKLSDDLSSKERELTSKTLFINQKNILLQRLITELDALKEEPGLTRNKVEHLQHELKMELSPDSWKEFEVQFNDVHPEFQSRLLEKYPDLTPTERRLCAFLRLDMNTREIASLTGQTFKSIEVARTRIRKKMNLSHEYNLTNFIASI